MITDEHGDLVDRKVPDVHPVTEWNVDCHAKDVTVSGSVAFAPSPFRGNIVRFFACPYRSGPGPYSTIVCRNKGVTISGCTTMLDNTQGVPFSFELPHNPLGPSCLVNEGDVISFSSDGAMAGDGQGVCAATFTVVLRSC